MNSWIDAEDFKILFNEAAKLADEERSDEAISLLNTLAKEHPESAAVWGLLGLLYYHQKNDFESAIDCFKLVVQISPMAETASLSLFHSLWSANKKEDAIKEAKRFLSKKSNSFYENIIKECEL